MKHRWTLHSSAEPSPALDSPPVAAFPKRLARVARHDAKVLRISARWLVTSREHHNYTYELTTLSRHHLAWFVSVVCDGPVRQVRGWLDEVESDQTLRRHIEQATAPAARRGLVDLAIGDSIASIGALERHVDLFLNDSDHSRTHEKREFDAVESKLAPGATLLTDNVTSTNVLAERTDRRFLAYRESPANHWYPGDGIGVAW
ncbi:class I SAM-dependent methyltransferase [Micromonospora arborensis]|uniref:class I SAM-dependent methyltransferase n=1 Tax=Micromonospora arborensis TaxID=2116518 RepID=UPI001FC9E00F|nr:class I SAM-dependent methyltransferase [Micromonospora arborensis]